MRLVSEEIGVGIEKGLVAAAKGEKAAVKGTQLVEETAEAAAKCKGPKCFVAGTLVQIAWAEVTRAYLSAKTDLERAVLDSFVEPSESSTTTKPIEQVKEGDIVVSRNVETGKTEFKKVIGTKIRIAPSLMVITLADGKTGAAVETIRVTPEHPFFVEGTGFTPAGMLCIGNAIVTRAGPSLVVKSLIVENHPQGIKVYNFEVEDDHSYFVGTANNGVWVHNYPIHHIATNKNMTAGKQWSMFFKPLFQKFGVNIDKGSENLVELAGHIGPHPNDYHSWVYNALRKAGSRKEFLQTLQKLKNALAAHPTMANPNWHGPFPPIN